MRHVIELRRVIDRAEEARQIVEEGIVAPADINLDRVAAGRLQRQVFVGVDDLRKVAAGEIDEPDMRAVLVVDGHAHFRRVQGLEIGLLDALEIFQQRFQALVLLGRPHDAPAGSDADPVQQIGIEHARLRHRGEGQRDDDLFAAVGVVAGETENVVEVGRADIDIGKNRIDRVGIVVVSHRDDPCFAVAGTTMPVSRPSACTRATSNGCSILERTRGCQSSCGWPG